MALKAQQTEEKLPPPPQRPGDSVAASEVSLYRSVLKIRQEHGLVNLGISFYDAETTIQWSYNADHYFHAASTMKLAVLLGVFRQIDRGELSLEAPVHIRNRFTSIVNQEPFMLDLGHDADPDVYGHLGRTLTVRELAYWMITKSSNLATNLLVDVVGIQTIQQALDELEIDGVKVLRGVEDQAAFDAGLNNEVTANGLLKLLRLIADGKAYSQQACDEMLKIMMEQQYRSGIPAGLPKAARVAHKTGNISTVHHDAGIVYLEGRKPYVLVILTQFAAETPRGTAVAEVSRDIFNTLAGTTYESP
ncbi:MAG TPA: serine hydrolase [Thermoanaerobaculia bacterium]|jgi:beta-lactamase class A|nr:serine hydrolase [Thermoanaerobaculia bacterium]